MRAGEAFSQVNVAAGTYGPYTLQGGFYQFLLVASGSGTATLEQVQPDGTWAAVPVWLDANAITSAPVTDFAASGDTGKVWLAPGRYRVVIATFTANYFTLVRIPTSE